ncbi:glycosyltransferase [Streptomyces sp. DSM 42041]|uniref:Glycosyltransferase n=1 Tax=Streptomyces hazeniae TaxID=3075538 RepID=A0ABU2NL48_9ACTN|nr:macrolide family glycosyltransferase [Streptomyces sp. DSM 42041]MDT0377709.1 glycosyltransferase [Streptomyces sp. DSM 42041]
MTGTSPAERPRRHLAFLPYPSYGHTMPVIAVLSELVARGHRVTCFASEEFAERVRATGAEVRLYEPPLSTASPPEVIDADESARSALRLLESSTAVMPAIEAAFADGPPDAVVYDTTLWLTGRLLAAGWERPRVQVSPTFISNEHFNLSDECNEFAGEIDPKHPALAEFAARLTELVTGSGLPEEAQAELFHGHEEFTVAFLPKEFQFSAGTFDARHAFVGPTVGQRREDHAWTPPADGRPVLLVSLGTTIHGRPDFFRDCARAFADSPWHVVMALGSRVDPADLGPLPPNVEAHSWVPLSAVLAHTSVFLCQSGMGSIMESLHKGVPMVVVPHHPEQKVNAKRLAQLGLAETVRPEDASVEALQAAVTRVCEDSGMRERAQEMRRHIHAAGGAARAADVIEDRLSTRSLEHS